MVAERPLTVADVVELAYGPDPDRILTDDVAVSARECGTEMRTVTCGETIQARDGLTLNVVTVEKHSPQADNQAPH
jgi:hypothetical protein